MKTILAATALSLIAGCASTESVAVRNPALAGKQFHKVVVLAGISTSKLAMRKQLEDGMVNELRGKGINAIPSLSLFLDEPDRPSRLAAYAAAGADCVLTIVVENAGVSSQQVSGPTTTTTGQASCYGGNCYGSSTSTTSPGMTVNRPHMTFHVRLFDLESDKVAWEQSAQGQGNGYANFNTVVASFESKTADDVVDASLFVTPRTAAR